MRITVVESALAVLATATLIGEGLCQEFAPPMPLGYADPGLGSVDGSGLMGAGHGYGYGVGNEAVEEAIEDANDQTAELFGGDHDQINQQKWLGQAQLQQHPTLAQQRTISGQKKWKRMMNNAYDLPDDQHLRNFNEFAAHNYLKNGHNALQGVGDYGKINWDKHSAAHPIDGGDQQNNWAGLQLVSGGVVRQPKGYRQKGQQEDLSEDEKAGQMGMKAWFSKDGPEGHHQSTDDDDGNGGDGRLNYAKNKGRRRNEGHRQANWARHNDGSVHSGDNQGHRNGRQSDQGRGDGALREHRDQQHQQNQQDNDNDDDQQEDDQRGHDQGHDQGHNNSQGHDEDQQQNQQQKEQDGNDDYQNHQKFIQSVSENDNNPKDDDPRSRYKPIIPLKNLPMNMPDDGDGHQGMRQPKRPQKWAPNDEPRYRQQNQHQQEQPTEDHRGHHDNDGNNDDDDKNDQHGHNDHEDQNDNDDNNDHHHHNHHHGNDENDDHHREQDGRDDDHEHNDHRHQNNNNNQDEHDSDQHHQQDGRHPNDHHQSGPPQQYQNGGPIQAGFSIGHPQIPGPVNSGSSSMPASPGWSNGHQPGPQNPGPILPPPPPPPGPGYSSPPQPGTAAGQTGKPRTTSYTINFNDNGKQNDVSYTINH